MTDKTICRNDGRCEYAIQTGAEKEGSCPAGACAMPCANPAAHLTIPGALEWDGDNGTHGVVGTHSADGEHSESAAAIATLKALGYTHNGGTHWKPPVGQKPDFSLIDSLKAFANEMISASFEGGSFEGGDIQDIAVKHGLLRIERRAEECGEVCACREYGFPAECYRKTDLLKPADEPADPAVEAGVVSAPKPYAAMTEAEADEFLSSFGGGSGNKAKRRIAEIEKAKTKICIECDQPYCHGVCVERCDQDYDRDQAAKGGDQ